jgi:hypothetical protein
VKQIPIQIERDVKNALVFHVTIEETAIAKTGVKISSIDIADAEKLLRDLKKWRAQEASKAMANAKPMNWLKSNAQGRFSLKEYAVHRKAAGQTPAHWRVGYTATFADPQAAQAFATAMGV